MLAWDRAERILDLGAGTHRHCNPGVDGDPPPFPAYVAEPTGTEVSTPESSAVPEFATWSGRPLIRIVGAAGADLYGLGEVCGSLRHRRRRITGATRDAYAYDERAASLYQAHPWILCVRSDGSAFGVIVETTWRFTAHVYEHLVVETDGPPPAVTVIEGAGPAEVVGRLTELTGPMPLPPRWALGFQQSRWSYEPASQVLEIAQEFRDRKLPADVIWVDIDYMDGFRSFTVDDGFGDPVALNDGLHDLGWRSAWMIDPGLKVDDDYDVYREARDGDHLLRSADGDELHGVVWPGRSAFPDFTRSETRDWWAGLHDDFLAWGVDAVWNDMNEPSTLEDVPDKALPDDAHHRADEELGGADTHARYRNVYGMLMTQASRAGIRAARPDRRPFLLTRSTFLGGHRHAATWTGDNVSSWKHLAWSIPMALNLGLSGQPLAGPDIGGFAGTCDGPLLARWMGIGCLLPFARNHNMKAMPGQEPWLFGADVEDTCRRALERRYRLLPHLYTLAREAATTGLPIVRPAFFAAPDDRELRDVDTAFLLGDDLYVRCDVDAAGTGPTAPVPDGWSRIMVLGTDAEATDADLPELYLRPGALLPLGPVLQWSDERPIDAYELVAHPDADGRATGFLYEDDGDGFAFEDGAYRLLRLEISGGTEVSSEVVDGDWPAPDHTWDVRTP